MESSMNFEGKRVKGLYLGRYPYTGVVTNCYLGGNCEIRYTIHLDEELIVLDLGRWLIAVTATEIDAILDSAEV
jgi:hypothetical protein